LTKLLVGYCDIIDVIIHKDNSITVWDNGRGIPTGIHEKENRSALEVVMTVLHAGGKFDKGSYKVSGGLHGVGVSCVNALSETLKATVYREGKVFEQTYHKGKPEEDVKIIGESEKNGTEVYFLPDKSIFLVTTYDFSILAARLRELSYLNKGITLTLTDERNTDDDGNYISDSFYSDNGLSDFIHYLDENRDNLTEEIISIDGEKNNVPVEIAMQYNTSFTENLHSYVNNINTIEGGTHLSGFRRGLTRTLKSYADKSGMLSKLKFDISGDDFREGLTAVISVKLSDPQFEGQTKAKLGNAEVRPAVYTVAKDYLTAFLNENPNDAKAILGKCLLAAQARKAARSARDAVIRKRCFKRFYFAW